MSIRCGVRWNRNWRRNRLCRKRPRQRPGRPLRETALLGLATSLCPSAGRYPDVHRLSSGRSIAKNCHSKTASIKMDYPLTVTTKPEPVWAGSRQAGGIVTQTANRVSPSGLVSAVADPRPRQTAIARSMRPPRASASNSWFCPFRAIHRTRRASQFLLFLDIPHHDHG
jgi:hypothetical protein